MVRSILQSLAFGLLLMCPCRAADAAAPDPQAERPAFDATAAEAIAALDEAAKAVAKWADAVDAGVVARHADVAELKKHLIRVHERAAGIIEATRKAHRAEQQAENARLQPSEQVKAWVAAMRALGDGAAEKQAAVVDQLRAALAGDDEEQQYAALQTLRQIGDVNYDKAEFRGLVFPLVRDSSGSMLVTACYALFNTEHRPNDLLLIQEVWSRRSTALDNAMSHLLFMFGDGKIEGRSADIVLELLDSPHADVRREALRGLWGAQVTDELAARIVELADDPESHHDAIYFALSTFKPKNEMVVGKLIETLTDPDWNNWDRALWGLGYGVPTELHPRVASALADMYVARSDPRTREKCVALIRQYAGDAAVEALPK
jgi:hypothetical protein